MTFKASKVLKRCRINATCDHQKQKTYCNCHLTVPYYVEHAFTRLKVVF